MKFMATITFPGDIDLIAPNAEPSRNKLVLRGEKLSDSEVFAGGHKIGKALAVDKQVFSPWFDEAVHPETAVVHETQIAMVLEVPLPAPDQHDSEKLQHLRERVRWALDDLAFCAPEAIDRQTRDYGVIRQALEETA